MNTLDYIFGETKAKDIHSAVLNGGHLTPEKAYEFYEMVKSNQFKSLCGLLTVISDRKGRHEQRNEDSYAAFPVELEIFLKGVNAKLTKKK